MGIERGALGSLLGHSGPVGESERYAARVFGAHRSYTVLNGTSASNRTIMTACVGDGEIALCDRNCHKSIEQGLALTGGIPVFITPTRNRYGIIGPAAPASLEPAAINASIAANPLAKNATSKKAGLQRAHQLHLRRHVLRLGRGRSAAREKLRPRAPRRSLVRLRALQPAVPQPVRHARGSCQAPQGWPDGVRDALHAQTTGGAVADLLDPHPRRQGRHRSWPLQRGLLHAGLHLTALPADRLERRGGGHDGRPRRPCAHPGNHRRGRGLPTRHRARAPGIRREERLVLRAVECARDQGCEKRQEGSFSRGLGRAARHRSGMLGAASGREVAWLRWHSRWLVHARSDQVRHRLSGHAGRRQTRRTRHPGRHRHRVYRASRHRAITHHRSHGAVPVLGGHHQGQVGHAA